jgi:cytochrome b pre-mRNA-processing protein 3
MDSPMIRMAKEMRKRAPNLIEPYAAYGGTQLLFDECSRHADYKLDREGIDDDAIPKLESGEHLGEAAGTGFWHNGTFSKVKSSSCHSRVL